eukprot:7455617-Pyramimonas_sp.AAC.1
MPTAAPGAATKAPAFPQQPNLHHQMLGEAVGGGQGLSWQHGPETIDVQALSVADDGVHIETSASTA